MRAFRHPRSELEQGDWRAGRRQINFIVVEVRGPTLPLVVARVVDDSEHAPGSGRRDWVKTTVLGTGYIFVLIFPCDNVGHGERLPPSGSPMKHFQKREKRKTTLPRYDNNCVLYVRTYVRTEGRRLTLLAVTISCKYYQRLQRFCHPLQPRPLINFPKIKLYPRGSKTENHACCYRLGVSTYSPFLAKVFSD